MSFRSNASYGRRQEYSAIARLLSLNHDVYVPLVDDNGIDCVVRKSRDRYLDIQIKARSRNCVLKHRGFFPNILIKDPRDNYFFIFYSELDDGSGIYWVMSSLDIVTFSKAAGSNINEQYLTDTDGTKRYKGIFDVRLAGANANPLERFRPYQDEAGFDRLL